MRREDEIDELTTLLVSRREQLRRALAGDLNALRQLRESGDEADWACSAAQGEISSQLAQVESRELAQIDRALERMREGTYGICEITGRPIPIARLRALPYATLCIEAQRELEKKGSLAECRQSQEGSEWDEN